MVTSDIYKIKFIILLLIVKFAPNSAQNELDTDISELGLTENAALNQVQGVSSTILYEFDNNTATDLSIKSNIYTKEEPAKVQKCCGINEELYIGAPLSKSKCQKSNGKFIIDVFTFNETHYWNYTNSNRPDVEIYVKDPCLEKKIFLDPINDINDTYRLLKNGSLYIPEMYIMHSVDSYCVDILHDVDQIFVTAMLCTTADKPDIFHYFFGAGQIISLISLILLAIYSMYRKDIDEDHKKCLAWFATVKALVFSVVIINTFAGSILDKNLNILLGYLYFYLTLKYYFWLNILCWDTRRCVQAGNENNRVSQMPKFLFAVFLLPLILLLISFIDFGNPAILNIYMNLAKPSKLWCILLFIVPISASCFINLFICTQITIPKMPKFVSTRSFITHMTAMNWTPPPTNINVLKNMYRRSCALFYSLGAFWIFDVVMYFSQGSDVRQVHNLFHAVVTSWQGLFILVIFIRKEWCYCKTNKHEPSHHNHELQPMHNGGSISA